MYCFFITVDSHPETYATPLELSFGLVSKDHFLEKDNVGKKVIVHVSGKTSPHLSRPALVVVSL